MDANDDGRGTNFSIFSEGKERAGLCLFGERIVDSSFYLMYNTHHVEIPVIAIRNRAEHDF